MNLNPYRWILLAALAAAIFIGIPILWHRHNQGQQDIGYQRRADEDREASRAQTESNRELSRLAELHLSAVATKQEQFFTKSTREIHDAAAPLVACTVPVNAVRLLNAAARCARQDSATACDGDPAVSIP